MAYFGDPNVMSPQGMGQITNVETGGVTSFGTPVTAIQPSQTQDDLANTDPRKILQRQHEDHLRLLESALSKAEDEVTRTTRYKLDTLDKEYQLKVKKLQDEYLGLTPVGKTAHDQLNDYEAALKQLNTNTDIARLRITQKVQPDVDLLREEAQQRIEERQQALRDQLHELDTIDGLERQGIITDPHAAQQARLRIAGIDTQITALRPTRAADLFTVTHDIDTYINDLIDEIGSFESKGWRGLYYSPTGRDEDQRPASKEENNRRKALITEIEKAREAKRQILADYWRTKGNEPVAQIVEKSGRLGRAQTFAMTGSTPKREEVTSLAQRIVIEKEKANAKNRTPSAPVLMAENQQTVRFGVPPIAANTPMTYQDFRNEVTRLNQTKGRKAAEEFYKANVGRFKR